MPISKRKKKLLCEFHDYHCEECETQGNLVVYKLEELEIHRIKRGYMGGTYKDHRNLKVVCKKHQKYYHANEFPNCKSK